MDSTGPNILVYSVSRLLSSVNNAISRVLHFARPYAIVGQRLSVERQSRFFGRQRHSVERQRHSVERQRFFFERQRHAVGGQSFSIGRQRFSVERQSCAVVGQSFSIGRQRHAVVGQRDTIPGPYRAMPVPINSPPQQQDILRSPIRFS